MVYINTFIFQFNCTIKVCLYVFFFHMRCILVEFYKQSASMFWHVTFARICVLQWLTGNFHIVVYLQSLYCFMSVFSISLFYCIRMYVYWYHVFVLSSIMGKLVGIYSFLLLLCIWKLFCEKYCEIVSCHTIITNMQVSLGSSIIRDIIIDDVYTFVILSWLTSYMTHMYKLLSL